MAKALYIGDSSNIARKVKKIYIGGSDGLAHKVKKIYIGDANGKARLAYTSSVPAGEVIFTSSQIWTVPDGVSKVDIFMIGGGASGAKGNGVYSGTGSWYRYAYSGVGGCSGKTMTLKNISVTPNSQISVVVGSGGAVRDSSGEQVVNNGGNSSFGSYSVEGGTAKTGGSGGGGSAQAKDGSISFSEYYRTDGASDGGTPTPVANNSQIISTGQGTTTRAWGEPTGTLYAGGGGGGAAWALNNNPESGGWSTYRFKGGAGGAGGGGTGGDYRNSEPATSGTPNTGSGGGGGGARAYSQYGYAYSSGAGGSGLVIVKWAAQE